MKAVVYGHKIFSYDLAWGFEQLGWEAHVANPSTVQDMDDLLARLSPELLITLGAPLSLNRNILEYLSKRRTPNMTYVHWDTDGISSQLYRSVSGEGIEMDVINASKPDMVFTMCPEMLEFLKTKGIDSHRLDYAFCPINHHPAPPQKEYIGKIVLLGQSYLEIMLRSPDHYRYKSLGYLVRPLLESGYQVDFFGEPLRYRALLQAMWKINPPTEWFHPYLAYDNTHKLYSGAFINLATQNHLHTITKRTFEILGSGGFLLSADNAAIREHFVPGRDLEVTSSASQTLEIVEYYKKNPDKYIAIRANALKTIQNHTYKQRAESIVNAVTAYRSSAIKTDA